MNKPHICVPLTGKTREDIAKQVDTIIPKKPDMLELRADFLTDLADGGAVLEILDLISDKTSIPLLFTIRSEAEGGEKISLSEGEKVSLLQKISGHNAVKYVDYEVANDRAFVKNVEEAVHKNGKKLILSYHNFDFTPENNELLKRFVQMEMSDADYAKIAVMPKEKDDLYRLLQVTQEADSILDIPVITMSMGELGAYSRLMGWLYGSALTFAVGVESSAPGQIPIDKLRQVINETKKLIGKN